ncbi:MAG: class I SAM-dependent methyltransferase [Clostridiales bacterium]|jgi:hypothetical protein|nr:class I SAM-dependent methyltransferase [Clostridiales bacterium]
MTTYLYGCSHYSFRYHQQFAKRENITGYLDDNSEMWGKTYLREKLPVYNPLVVLGKEYDKIVICNKFVQAREKMKCNLLGLGVPESKIVVYTLDKIQENAPRTQFLRNYARFISDESIEGAVAECGVHQGAFAWHISKLFPNRKLYLFDTFEGFAEKDIQKERELNQSAFLNGGFNKPGGFPTDETSVLENMPYKENVIIKKGYVPKTFSGVKDTFMFVNLDMDLHQPTLNALRFFYPRIVGGGVILLHDYFHPELPGVKQAVKDFENELGKPVAKACISDNLSLQIIKI